MIYSNKKFLIVLVIVLLGLFLCPILVYSIKFGNLTLSKNLQDWSNFGGFLSGTIGVIFSSLNVMAFIVLTIEISKQGEKLNEKDNNIQKRLVKEQLQFQAYNDIYSQIMKRISDIEKIVTDKGYDIENSTIIDTFLRYKFLFLEITDTELENTIQKTEQELLNANSNYRKTLSFENERKRNENFNLYKQTVFDFINKLQQLMLK